MTRKLTLLITLPAVAGMVTACGGGGGRSHAPPVAKVGAPAPTPTLKNPNGKAHFVFVPKAGFIFPKVAVPNGRTSSPALVEVSQTKDTKTIQFQGPSRLINAENIPKDDDLSEPGVSIYGESDKLVLATVTTLGTTSLEHSEFGLIGDHRQAESKLGAYHAGKLTRLDQLPTGVIATYSGVFSGSGGAVGDSALGLGGSANITANFGSGVVKGQVGNLHGKDVLSILPTRQDYGLSIQGKITGNTYSGTAGFTDTTGQASGTVSSSAMTGGFYGPKAGETAGALRIEGTPGGTASSPHVIVGGFGAKRK